MPTTADVAERIHAYLSTIDRSKTVVEVAFFGGSFTGIPLKMQHEYLETAAQFLRKGRIDGIRISTRPDYIDDGILSVLKQYGVTTIELGVQSMDARVLKLSRRGHTLSDVIRASNLIKYHGFKLGLQMMIGLPGDTFEHSYETAQQLILLKPDAVRVYPTVVFRDTELHDMMTRGEYRPLTLDEAVEHAADILQLFYAHGIPVIRVGLQPTDELVTGGDVADGPFHPAFRQLVESRMFRTALEESLVFRCDDPIRITVHPRDYSTLVGQNQGNIAFLKSQFALEDFAIEQNPSVPRFSYQLRIADQVRQYTVF